ncbi:MAG: hypothetical protein LUD18_03200 [Lachnospiraceae bacterium]|nr:hypothetical protein [Lachnospiraceae bacterium]
MIMLYALYNPQSADKKDADSTTGVNGRLIDFGTENEACFMYDRRIAGVNASHLNISPRPNAAPRSNSSPRICASYIRRPCVRKVLADAAAISPQHSKTIHFNWDHYAFIPHVFQLKMEKLRKCFDNRDNVDENGKVRGEWRTLTATVFPEFVFFERDDHGEQNSESRTSLPIVQLSEEASSFLTSLTAAVYHANNHSQAHTIRMSRGIIRNGRAHVTEGPLVGYDDRIFKVDRHKRLAWVWIDKDAAVGRKRISTKDTNVLTAGLEIYEKL